MCKSEQVKRSKMKRKMKCNVLLEDTNVRIKFCQKVEE